MVPTSKLALSFLASTTLIASAAWAEHVREGARIFTVELTGEAECNAAGTACNLGDLDGTGTITLYVNPGQKRVCYDLTLAGIDTPTAAHIHDAPAGRAGGVFFGFPTPPLGTSAGCANATSQQLAALISKPSNYYYNVHNSAFPGGALRGQLGGTAH